MRQGRPSLAGLVRLTRVLAAERPAILQTWCKTADLVGFVAGRALGLRNIVWNIRGSSHPPGQLSRATRLCELACAVLSPGPRVVLVNSEAGRAAHVRKGYRPARWQVIPNGFDVDAFRPDPYARRQVRRELGIPEGSIAIGTAGRYHAVKDFATFVHAAAIAAARHDQWHFVMAGAGLTASNGELLRAVWGTEAAGRLHLLGERADMPRVLAALDLFTLTSLSEGFPKLWAGVACGVACVVTEVQATRRRLWKRGVLVRGLPGRWSLRRRILAVDRVRAALGQAAGSGAKRVQPRRHRAQYESSARPAAGVAPDATCARVHSAEPSLAARPTVRGRQVSHTAGAQAAAPLPTFTFGARRRGPGVKTAISSGADIPNTSSDVLPPRRETKTRGGGCRSGSRRAPTLCSSVPTTSIASSS